MVKIMVPNPIKIHDLGLPLFLETPIYFWANYNSQTWIKEIFGGIPILTKLTSHDIHSPEN